jgi:hypothetical protein
MSPPNFVHSDDFHEHLNVDWDYKTYYANNPKPSTPPRYESYYFTTDMQDYLYGFIHALE